MHSIIFSSFYEPWNAFNKVSPLEASSKSRIFPSLHPVMICVLSNEREIKKTLESSMLRFMGIERDAIYNGDMLDLASN